MRTTRTQHQRRAHSTPMAIYIYAALSFAPQHCTGAIHITNVAHALEKRSNGSWSEQTSARVNKWTDGWLSGPRAANELRYWHAKILWEVALTTPSPPTLTLWRADPSAHRKQHSSFIAASLFCFTSAPCTIKMQISRRKIYLCITRMHINNWRWQKNFLTQTSPARRRMYRA